MHDLDERLRETTRITNKRREQKGEPLLDVDKVINEFHALRSRSPDSLPAGDRYTVAYEDFASSETGHEEALKLAKFLELNDGVEAEMSEDNVTCLWNAIVGGDEEGAASHYLPLKEKQFDLMIYEIERLYSKYHGKDGDIMPILVRYLEMAKTKRNEEIASWSLFSS